MKQKKNAKSILFEEAMLLYKGERNAPTKWKKRCLADDDEKKTRQGVTWQKLRSSLTPELTRAKTVLGFFPALNGVTDDFIELIRDRRGGNTVVGFEELAYRIGLESEFFAPFMFLRFFIFLY